MTTFSDLIEECQNAYLLGGQTLEMNRLNGSVGAADTSINFHYAVGSMAQKGQVIAVDLELIRVWDTSGSQATVVERGVRGSTAATHTDGTAVQVGSPGLAKWPVAHAINSDLADLSGSGLYKVGTLEISYNPAVQGYDLAGVPDFDRIIDLRYKLPGPSKDWPQLRNYMPLRNQDPAVFPSGNAIVVYEGAYPGLPILVRYRTPFTNLVNPTDDVVAVAGLPSTAVDLPPLGAAIRLMAGAEFRRNSLAATRDPSIMGQSGVPPGALLNSPKVLMGLRQERIVQEASRLAARYPQVAMR